MGNDKRRLKRILLGDDRHTLLFETSFSVMYPFMGNSEVSVKSVTYMLYGNHFAPYTKKDIKEFFATDYTDVSDQYPELMEVTVDV